MENITNGIKETVIDTMNGYKSLSRQRKYELVIVAIFLLGCSISGFIFFFKFKDTVYEASGIKEMREQNKKLEQYNKQLNGTILLLSDHIKEQVKKDSIKIELEIANSQAIGGIDTKLTLINKKYEKINYSTINNLKPNDLEKYITDEANRIRKSMSSN